jgi:sodium/hydrogen exchanger 8
MYQTVIQSMRSTAASPVVNIFMSGAFFMLIFVGSFAIGCAVAFATSYLLKRLQPSLAQEGDKKLKGTEIAIMIIAPVLSYLIAQGISLSGIVSILFCGFVLSQYAADMLSTQTRKILKFMYQSAAYVCESTVFLFLGMSAVEFYVAYAYHHHIWRWIERRGLS